MAALTFNDLHNEFNQWGLRFKEDENGNEITVTSEKGDELEINSYRDDKKKHSVTFNPNKSGSHTEKLSINEILSLVSPNRIP